MSYEKPEQAAKFAGGASFEERFIQAREIPEMLIRSGGDFARKGKVKIQSDESRGAGITELSGSVQSAFGFVNHPSLTVTRRGDRLLVERYRCGCREGSREQFCTHCAALLACRFRGMEARLPEEGKNQPESDLKGIRIRLGTHRKSR